MAQFELSQVTWPDLGPTSPFIDRRFFEALTLSHSVGEEAGWIPLYFTDSESGAMLYSFVKGHSYGEYIFDWNWAEAYSRHSLAYYPKLTSMIPLTPSTQPHFLMRDFDASVARRLLQQLEEFYQTHSCSSLHFLFVTESERDFLKDEGYLLRESFQYHFVNERFLSFSHFLSTLKAKKAKTITQERSFPELRIERVTGESLTREHAREMYQFYLSTISKKQSYAYLREEFFLSVFESMKDKILYVRALLGDEAIAGSLFFFDQEKLYGRYWGARIERANLHFELCYYQGIDFCIENKLKVFEAGAQGEHKIPRGFRPVRTYSAHKIKHPGFAQAISGFIDAEKKHVASAIDELSRRLPFRSE